jgi:hypothetical protein
MRYYKAALIFGIMSMFAVTLSYSYYRFAQMEVKNNQTKLQAILAANEQRRDYGKKIEAIKACSSKLIALSREHKTNVDYEIILTDHDVKKLLSKVASTYSDGFFFLDKGTIESTQSGITVTMKGFKLGEETP